MRNEDVRGVDDAIERLKQVDPNDQIRSSLNRARGMKAVRTATWWARAATFVIGIYLMFNNGLFGSLWVLPAFVLLWAAIGIVGWIVKSVMTYVEEATSGVSSLPPAQSLVAAKSMTIPRRSDLPVESDAHVIADEKQRLMPSQAIEHGGRLEEDSEIEALPAGIVLFTESGLAFFPESEGVGELTSQVAKLGYELAKTAAPALSAIGALGLDEGFRTDELSLPDWLVAARQNRNHFVVPWLELVTISHDPKDYVVRLTREYDDGNSESFALFVKEDGWVDVLTLWRFQKEVAAVSKQYVRIPKAHEMLPEIEEKFAEIYDDRIDAHREEIYRELSQRVQDWITEMDEEEVIDITRRYMETTLPHYAKNRLITEKNPELFE